MRLALPGPVSDAQRGSGAAQPIAAVRTLAASLAASWSGGGPDNRHSRRVALLKRVLPAIGLGLLLLIAAWPRLAPLWDRFRFAFPAIDLRAARELTMINLRYAGIDHRGRPFLITAASGRQLPDRKDLMSLKLPRADLKAHRDANIVITAETGVYQSLTQLLDLAGNVTLVHQDGTRIVTAAARVDAANNSAEGNSPVEGHGPSGDIKAQGFRLLDKGDTILFTGKSELLLKRARPTAATTSPAALPAPIAAAAARAANEAKPALAAAAAAQRSARHSAARRPVVRHPAARHPAVRRATAHARPAHHVHRRARPEPRLDARR
jgi:lipopolysaccharide export system protein LptC